MEDKRRIVDNEVEGHNEVAAGMHEDHHNRRYDVEVGIDRKELEHHKHRDKTQDKAQDEVHCKGHDHCMELHSALVLCNDWHPEKSIDWYSKKSTDLIAKKAYSERAARS